MLAESFKAKLKARDPKSPNIRTQSFFDGASRLTSDPTLADESSTPSRMLSDQMINVFFQEWSPLFPILHRPSALNLYTNYVAEPTSVQSPHDIAQLYLIFGIAAISTEVGGNFNPSTFRRSQSQSNKHDALSFERMWQRALDKITKDVSIPTLQCFLLAELYWIAKDDSERLRKCRIITAKLVRRLGLHQSQRRSSLGPLLTESRKRLFWVTFTLDW